MKKVKVITVGFILFCVAFGISSETYAWVGNSIIMVDNIAGRRAMPNGLFLYIGLLTSDPLQAANVKSMRAWNQDINVDPNIYVLSFQFNEVRKTGTDFQFLIETPYTGQYGVYNIEVTYQDDSTEIIPTLPINPWSDPYPVPTGIEVDFSTGISTPTFRFMPIDSLDIDYYLVRVRQYESTGSQVMQARRIYRTTQITSWTTGQLIEVTLPQSSDGSGTGEPLLPGVEYEVRVEAYDMNGAYTPPTWQTSFRSDNRVYFRIPAKSILYDDFSGTSIDLAKWRQGEYVQEIQNEKLVSKTTAYGSRVRNRLVFSNPGPIYYIEADVVIENIEGNLGSTGVPNYASPRAQLTGFFYNDGTASGPGSLRGEVQGEIQIRSYNNQLWVNWFVVKSTNDNFTSWTVLNSDSFPDPVSLNTTYKLSVQFDPSSKMFTFKVGEITRTWASTDTINPSNSPWKAIGTDVPFTGIATGLYGRIFATFDNVIAQDELGNAIVSDNFSSTTIDSAKWRNYEFVREISGGKLRSKVRSSTASASTISNRLEFINPSSIETVKVKVTPVSYQNDQGVEMISAMTGGIYYNDGTPGGGFLGDVIAGIGIGGSGGSPVAGWRVSRFTDSTGQNTETVANGPFTTPITLGTTYDLFIGWNGSRFIFKINNEVAEFTPTTSIHSPNNPRGEIGTIVRNPGGKEAVIEALFDDVEVNLLPKSIVDFDGDSKTDIAVYRSGTGAWYVIPSSGASPYGVGWGGDGTDKSAPGDYDGDGKTDIAVYRAGTGAWYVYPSGGGAPYGFGWGGDTTDKPAPGDYDGDGKTDIAVYRAGTGAWYVIPSGGGAPYGFGWGGDGTDKPAPGDYDGDGKTDIAVYRSGTGAWYVIPSSGASPYGVGWGGDASDKPAPGDYDGDGKTDIAVYREGTGAWYVYPSGGGSPYGRGWGGDLSDKPAPGDYDGDGKTDCAVYRANTGAWYVYPSAGGAPYGLGWGGDATDKPVTMNLSALE
jgi:hypothetical protein